MDVREFNRVYVPLAEYAYRVAYRILESREAAEDAVQDLYVKLLDSRDTLDEVQSPKAYCLTLMRNLCIDRIRRSRKESHPGNEAFSVSAAPDSGLIERETIARVLRIVDGLPEKQRRVLKMKVFDGLSYEEISKATGLSMINLRVLLSMARKNIRRMI